MRLGEAPGTDGLRGLLADALDDPRLQLLYWVEGCWVKRDGQAGRDPARTARGRRSSSRASASARSSTTAACAPSPRCSTPSPPRPAWRCAPSAWRPRCAARAPGSSRRACQERRRLERNLHDGAQQRLVALSLTLRIAQNQIAKDARAGGGDGRRRAGGAHARARGAARARPRHPPGRALRSRPAGRRRGARRALAAAGQGRRGPGRAAARAGRGRGLLRHRRGADQRRQVRQRERGHGGRSAGSTGTRRSKCATMASAARIPAVDRACAASPTVSAHWTVPWHSTLHPGRALLSERRFPYEHRRYTH